MIIKAIYSLRPQLNNFYSVFVLTTNAFDIYFKLFIQVIKSISNNLDLFLNFIHKL